MKKRIAHLGMMTLAMHAIAHSQESITIEGQGKLASDKPEKPKRDKVKIPFEEQEGVAKIIKEYKLILSGKSKKGVLKQNRIKSKISEWIKLGFLPYNIVNDKPRV